MLPIKKPGRLPMVLRDPLPKRFEKIRNQDVPRDHESYPVHIYLQDNPITVQKENSEIVKFLTSKGVLVTGATGFLGKLLVEKLPRCTENITVFVLVREKKGKNIQERLEEMFDSYAFHRLSKIHRNFRKNVVGIPGDISLPNLGLNEESIKLLIEKVNIIYHAGATVRFDEKLKRAVETNVMGTKEIIKLAKMCEHLEALVYLGTAYSNCDKKVIKEEFYEPTMMPEQLIGLTNLLPESVLDKITPQLLGSLPNTYALTKQTAEIVIKTETAGLPVCICRPSIVTSASKEPFKGWGDNLFGPIGYMILVALGIVHVQKCCVQKRADFIPADFVINSCIAASHKTAQDGITKGVPKIYNVVSQPNPTKWKPMQDLCCYYGKHIGSTLSLFDYHYICTESDVLYFLIRLLYHRIPAYIVDFAAICIGKKPSLNAAYDKIHKFGTVLTFFTMNEWYFESQNTAKLWNSLNDVDKKNFNFDIRSLDWAEYFAVFLVALRESILHEHLDNIDESRRRQKRLHLIRLVLQTLVMTLAIYSVYKLILIIGSILV